MESYRIEWTRVAARLRALGVGPGGLGQGDDGGGYLTGNSRTFILLLKSKPEGLEMAFCPEDGTKMVTVCLHHHACYDCPECEQHWNYVEGTYEVGRSEQCPVYNSCPRCEAERRNAMTGQR